MKILMIAPEPILEPRGTPISVYQRLFALSSLKHQVDLLTYPQGEEVILPGLTIYRIPNLPFIRSIKPGPSWAKFFMDILIFIKAIFMLLRQRYDVIHTHEEASFMAIFLGYVFRTQHLYDMHSCLPQQLINFKFTRILPLISIFEFLENWAIRSSDAVITIGMDLQNHVKKIKPDAKVITIENLPIQAIQGLTEHFQNNQNRDHFNPNGKVIVLYSGTFEPYQGLDLLIESAEIVINHHPEVFFVLNGGQANQIDPLMHITREKNIADKFYFSGPVPLWETLSFLEQASILVSPRLQGTTIPLKLYTYMLSGKPIVATRTSAHEQILQGDLALLIPEDKEALANGIMRLLNDPELGNKLGLNARIHALKRYNLENYINKVDDIYQTLRRSNDNPK